VLAECSVSALLSRGSHIAAQRRDVTNLWKSGRIATVCHVAAGAVLCVATFGIVNSLNACTRHWYATHVRAAVL
jgi:hypothetical protein